MIEQTNMGLYKVIILFKRLVILYSHNRYYRRFKIMSYYEYNLYNEELHLKFISTGLCPGCLICMDNYGYDSIEEFNNQVDSGEIFDEGAFSWSPCDLCQTSLGGNSYISHGIDIDNNLNHFTVCSDCLFLLNGYTYNEELQAYE